MKRRLLQPEILIEALPYIREFTGKPFVVKLGGSTLLDEAQCTRIAGDIALLKLVGIQLVVVHGGGKHINEMLQRLGIQNEFKNGLRVTNEETMRIVEMVLSGRSNKDIVTLINRYGGKALGISGKDGPLIRALPYTDANGGTYGQVGIIESVAGDVIEHLLTGGFIPVISPVAYGEGGRSYNLNADHAASRIAQAICAKKLIYLSDIPGVLRDPRDPGTLISELGALEAEALIADGTISGGMLPKIQSIVECLRHGVEKVHIISGLEPHALLLEIFTNGGIGTEFHAAL
ncbi:MAG: acetylglutamate kinase [Spirochaetota bacterium]|jgi:acetylglutamate kinase|nr:acetylglutamate kinase [Spirochaetota bacterium]